ncbi:MAG TPA: AAA family ATPase [Candidatus Saccharimonadales bacterium]
MKVILLNGFAGAGKTTIAKRYIDQHPLSVVIEGDELIVNIGNWVAQEDEARQLVFELTKAMLRTCLESGHDVVLPYLVTDADHAEEFKQIAEALNADFYEFILHTDREDTIARLLKRGTWGEAGQPPISDKDMPAIEELADKMEAALKLRQEVIALDIKESDPDATYSQLLNSLI